LTQKTNPKLFQSQRIKKMKPIQILIFIVCFSGLRLYSGVDTLRGLPCQVLLVDGSLKKNIVFWTLNNSSLEYERGGSLHDFSLHAISRVEFSHGMLVRDSLGAFYFRSYDVIAVYRETYFKADGSKIFLCDTLLGIYLDRNSGSYQFVRKGKLDPKKYHENKVHYLNFQGALFYPNRELLRLGYSPESRGSVNSVSKSGRTSDFYTSSDKKGKETKHEKKEMRQKWLSGCVIGTAAGCMLLGLGIALN
jgi:hypothetical protein